MPIPNDLRPLQPPEDLAGYQHITYGIVEPGDVIVRGDLRIKEWAESSLYGDPISGIDPYLDVYRKIECPRHEGQTKWTQRVGIPLDKIPFASGSLRESKKGKGRFDLIPYEPTRQLAVHFEEGGIKHGDRNWELGQPLSIYLNSAKRHAAQAGSMKDENHAISSCWNFFCLLQTAEWIKQGKLPKELDDIGWISKE